VPLDMCATVATVAAATVNPLALPPPQAVATLDHYQFQRLHTSFFAANERAVKTCFLPEKSPI